MYQLTPERAELKRLHDEMERQARDRSTRTKMQTVRDKIDTVLAWLDRQIEASRRTCEEIELGMRLMLDGRPLAYA